MRKIDRDNQIQQSCISDKLANNIPYMRPRARPVSFGEDLNTYSTQPTNNIPKGSALEGNWAAYVPKDLSWKAATDGTQI